MRQDYAQRILPFVQAAAEGKTIQYREYDGKWCDTSPNHMLFDDDMEYRVKPSPVVLFTVYTKSEHDGFWTVYCSRRTREMAETVVRALKRCYSNRQVKIIEVTVEE